MILALVAALGGCRKATAASATASCDQYPIPLHPAEGAQAAAQADLASLSPGATMTWNGNTGTLTSVLQLSVPLPRCTDGQDVNAQVYEVLEAHPALFQMALAEWAVAPPFDCKFVVNDTLNMGRSTLAGRPVAKDVFAYRLQRIDGVVSLTSVSGAYLPVVGAAVGDTMAACNNLTETAATASARNARLTATVFSQCQRTGTVTYTPKANDHIQWPRDEVWGWDENTGEALLSGERIVRVILDPANHTPELLSSDARCPGPDGDGSVVGFEIRFDVHTGQILHIKPGLDCVVC